MVNRTSALDDSLNYPGLRPLDGHMDVIDTEIISMNLTGMDPLLGWVFRVGVDQGVAPASLGAVAETPTDDLLADSFFDIFFELDSPTLGTLHNNDAVRVQTVVNALPPFGSDYAADILIGNPVPIYNENNEHVANLTELTSGGTGHHRVIPAPHTMVLLLLGMACLAFCRKV